MPRCYNHRVDIVTSLVRCVCVLISEHYSELPGPTEETERDMAPVPTDTLQNPSKKHKQPLPVPVHYKKRTPGANITNILCGDIR